MSIYVAFEPPRVSHPRFHFEMHPRFLEREDQAVKDRRAELRDSANNEGEDES